MEAVRGTGIEVYIDGGVRLGTDVLKALALGARAVFVGRPVIWGLAYKVPNWCEFFCLDSHSIIFTTNPLSKVLFPLKVLFLLSRVFLFYVSLFLLFIYVFSVKEIEMLPVDFGQKIKCLSWCNIVYHRCRFAPTRFPARKYLYRSFVL